MSARWWASPDGLLLAADGQVPRRSSVRAVLLDRDGTLNAAVPDPDSGQLESPLRVEDVRLLPGAAGAAAQLAAADFTLVCVSNQPAAAKGKCTVTELRAIHERVLELLAREGVDLARSYLCLAHPDASVPALRGPCDCRKPAPGMLLEAARTLGLDLDRSWMIGDTDGDVGAGQAVGCATALIEYAGSAHKRAGNPAADIVARDLTDAGAQVLACAGGQRPRCA